MKKLFFGLALVFAMASCSSDSYKISGKIEDVSEGTVYLKKIGVDSIEDIDSTTLKNGEFTFTGSVVYPELYYIFVNEIETPIAFFNENSSISITGSTKDPQKAVIKGSKHNDLLVKFEDEMPSIEVYEQLRDEYMRAQAMGDNALAESIIADLQVATEERKSYIRDFINANNNNAVGALLAINFAQIFEQDEILALADTMTTNLGDHPYVVMLNEMLAPLRQQQLLTVGNEAPLFTLKDINGNDVSLESFRGKYVFIDFWASWCRPCREENPNLVALYKEFGGEDFEIISISLDETAEKWMEAVKEDGLSWTLLHDADGSVALHMYAVQSIPSTWVLDREGKIIYKDLRGAEIASTIGALLQ